eukprot:PhF_6_TR14221/c0_g1_i1/m.22804
MINKVVNDAVVRAFHLVKDFQNHEPNEAFQRNHTYQLEGFEFSWLVSFFDLCTEEQAAARILYDHLRDVQQDSILEPILAQTLDALLVEELRTRYAIIEYERRLRYSPLSIEYQRSEYYVARVLLEKESIASRKPIHTEEATERCDIERVERVLLQKARYMMELRLDAEESVRVEREEDRVHGDDRRKHAAGMGMRWALECRKRMKDETHAQRRQFRESCEMRERKQMDVELVRGEFGAMMLQLSAVRILPAESEARKQLMEQEENLRHDLKSDKDYDLMFVKDVLDVKWKQLKDSLGMIEYEESLLRTDILNDNVGWFHREKNVFLSERNVLESEHAMLLSSIRRLTQEELAMRSIHIQTYDEWCRDVATAHHETETRLVINYEETVSWMDVMGRCHEMGVVNVFREVVRLRIGFMERLAHGVRSGIEYEEREARQQLLC